MRDDNWQDARLESPGRTIFRNSEAAQDLVQTPAWLDDNKPEVLAMVYWLLPPH